LLAVPERPICDAAARRALALIVRERMGHGLGAKLRLERGALASALKRGESPRLRLLGRRLLAQLLLGRRDLLRLGPEHAPLERFHHGRDGGQLAPELRDLGPRFGELAPDDGELAPEPLRFFAPGAVMIVGQLRHDLVWITSGGACPLFRKTAASTDEGT